MDECSLDGASSYGAVQGHPSIIGFPLKEDVTSSSLAASVIKTEQAKGVFVVDVKEHFPNKPKDKVHASTSVSMSIMVISFSRYAQATQMTLASLGAPPDFDPL